MFKRKSFFIGCLIVAAAQSVAPPRARAQAYCALRDPVRSIYALFPDATSFQSIVRTVGEQARTEVSKRLPFTLHYNELGRHTLYVALKDATPLGFIHVRSEAGEWGLLEIAWAFDTSLKVLDFKFQRCRDSKRKSIEAESFRSQIQGSGFAQLRELIDDHGDLTQSSSLSISSDSERLATDVIRSALKTMTVTDVVWHEDVRLAKLLHRAFTSFPSATSINAINDAYSPGVLKSLQAQLGRETSDIERETVNVLRAIDDGGTTVGYLVRTDWKPYTQRCPVWWSIAPDIKVLKAKGSACDSEGQRGLSGLDGTSLDDLKTCATAVQLAALEVLMLCKEHLAH